MDKNIVLNVLKKFECVYQICVLENCFEDEKTKSIFDNAEFDARRLFDAIEENLIFPDEYDKIAREYASKTIDLEELIDVKRKHM